MQKKFVTNLAFLLFINLLIKPFYILIIDVKWQNVVQAENYGIYFAIFNLSFVLNILLDVGITNFNNKSIAQNSHLLTKHFSSLVVLKLLLAVTYLIIVLIIGLVIQYDYRLIKLMLVLAFNQFLISFILYLRSNLAALHLFWIDSIVSVLDRSILIILCVLLLWYNVLGRPLDIMDYVYAQTISYLTTAIIAFFIVLTKTSGSKFKLSRAFAISILKKSFPFAILMMLMACYNRLDTVMIERMLSNGAEQAGIYAQGYRLLDATNMIAFLFAGLLLPIFSKMIKHKESVESLVKTAFILLMTPAVIIAIGCWFYSIELIGMLYDEHIEQSALVFSILMSCFAAISTTYIFGTLLTANGNLRELNLMAASGILINIVMNLFLIPRFEAAGSAVSSLITQFSTAFIQVLIAQNIFKFKINYKLILTLIIFIAGVVLINYVSKLIHPNWMINFSIMVVACGLWAFATRMISIKSMMRVLKYG
ncbi:MAG TPA: oligosaccharide flippase family protein [Bacteroidia bacterium]|jgi:O-antigen/teichoic acid export membrane protein|nr:oligosaccharide flippase family protein [Bacteroidia bacterium]